MSVCRWDESATVYFLIQIPGRARKVITGIQIPGPGTQLAICAAKIPRLVNICFKHFKHFISITNRHCATTKIREVRLLKPTAMHPKCLWGKALTTWTQKDVGMNEMITIWEHLLKTVVPKVTKVSENIYTNLVFGWNPKNLLLENRNSLTSAAGLWDQMTAVC